MTRRRLRSNVDQNPQKAASLTDSQARAILSFEDAPVREAVIAGGLLLFSGATTRGTA
ncbi:hypothetical protein [Microbacterium maritypicum]